MTVQQSSFASQVLFRPLYHALIAAGRPFNGVRPRRLYETLGHLAYPKSAFSWHRNRWGHELELSPSYHIDRNILIFGTYDPKLHLALERLIRPGYVCFDVGANLGEMALHMAKLVGDNGAVYAFEPAPPAFQRLRTHVERNNLQSVIRTFPLALSDATGTCEMRFADESQDNQGLGSIIDNGPKAGRMRAWVGTITLDDLVSRYEISKLDLMKIDIQGAEIKLLEGGRRVLTELAPDLLVEISPDDLDFVGKTNTDLCRLIESYGYRIHHLLEAGVGPRIHAAEVPRHFAAASVYCTKRRVVPCERARRRLRNAGLSRLTGRWVNPDQ